jgi:hypothetical protein
MRIESTSSALINLRNAPKVSGGGASEAAEASKSLGETPPLKLSMAEIGALADLFAPGGIVSKLKRRLNRLKNKKCEVVPAKGTVACIDSNDLVYLGIEFLQEFAAQEDVIAGVMSHEWGHSCADRPTPGEIESLNWDEIFELRRAHETLADELSGRLLALMGYTPDNLIKFLQRGKETHNLKYHSNQVRADVIRNGHAEELKKIKLANEVFPKTAYSNHFHSKIIDEV